MAIFPREQYAKLRLKIHDYSQSVTDSLETSRAKNQIVALDGIRAIACLAVISFHLNYLSRIYDIWQPSHGVNAIVGALSIFGDSGVILFFLLSGFLLFLPFAKALLFDSSWPLIMRFYIRRIFRIVPAYYLSLFLIILFFHPYFLHHARWHDVFVFLTFRMDFSFSQALNGPFWTLATEFQFYLLLPIIAWVLAFIVRGGELQWRLFKLTICLMFMVAWGLLTRYWGLHVARTSTLDFLLPHAISARLEPYIYGDNGKYFEVFALGMLLCMVYVYTQNAFSAQYWQEKLRRLSPFALIAGVLILFFLSIFHFYQQNLDVFSYANPHQIFTFLDPYKVTLLDYWSQWQAFGYGMAYVLCMGAIIYGSARLKAPFEWALLRWIGFISFSLYIWHVPFILLFFNVLDPGIRGAGFNHGVEYVALCCWVLFVVFPLALTFYRWIEMPGIRAGEFLVKSVEKMRGKSKVSTKIQDVIPTPVSSLAQIPSSDVQ